VSIDDYSEVSTHYQDTAQHAGRTLHEALEHGSFYKVTEACKAVGADLFEQVQPVRK
jgi:hypothetical protein